MVPSVKFVSRINGKFSNKKKVMGQFLIRKKDSKKESWKKSGDLPFSIFLTFRHTAERVAVRSLAGCRVGSFQYLLFLPLQFLSQLIWSFWCHISETQYVARASRVAGKVVGSAYRNSFSVQHKN